MTNLLLDKQPDPAWLEPAPGSARGARHPGTKPAGAPREIADPGAGGLSGRRIRPGRRYVLPEAALHARVTPIERDLLLLLHHGGLLLLREVITVEVMADPPVFQIGARDFLASLLAVLALADGGGATLQALCTGVARPASSPPQGIGPALRSLRRDGILPPSGVAEWDLP